MTEPQSGAAVRHDAASVSRPAPSELGRQRWRHLLPIVFITYSLAYLDRSNFSIAVAGGLKSDLGLSSGLASLVGASFFLGYFLFQIPGALYAERRSVNTLIFWSLIAWGTLASVQAALTSATALIVVRFLLGLVEGAVLPAMVILLSRWFTKRERGRANSVLILGNPVTVLWLTAVSGYLIDLTSWRGMFLIEGLPAIAWAFVFRAKVADSPERSTWLDPAEKSAVTAALEAEQQHITPVNSYVEAFRSRNVVMLSVQYLLWSLGVYGFVFWLPSIVKAGSGAGIGATGLISAAPYALAVILMIVNSRFSDRAESRNRFVWPWLALGAAAFYGSYLLGASHFWLSFVLLVIAGGAMYAPYGPYFANISELLPRSVAGPSVALINSFGALGGFLGSYLVGWVDSATGTKGASFLVLAVALLLSALIMPFVRASGTASTATAPVRSAA
ncbi:MULTISPECIES: MFS transporter [unclassified Streptomyces]|uniref:MFS transporter n=1 Tax=unclassified Streptomyces TaxID=2593676 RepID=UPI002741C199|nr:MULTISPECIES: MFS transporter [unclassified Streptomyces]